MTTQEQLIANIMANGPSEEQAKAITAAGQKYLEEMHTVLSEYQITWNSPATDYPAVMHNIIFDAIKVPALNWIEENKPMAWFKPMFQSQE